MKDQLHNSTKDNNIIPSNNYSSELSKNQVPTSNINTNMNSNSFSQENIFNELINSTNYQESKNNSSFYNFSESVHSNPENPNIIMNKDQLYQTFLLFQKFLNQNINNNNVTPNNIPPQNENEIHNKYKAYNKKTLNNININNNNNVIDEINEFDDNEEENDNENEEPSNGKIVFRKNRTTHNWRKNKINPDEDNNNKALIESKSHYNIINGGNKNNDIIYFDEKNNNNILYKDDYDRTIKINNKNIQIRNNSIDINRKPIGNSYDDIPIKFNRVNFIDLVEKKLADEKNCEFAGKSNFEMNKKIKNLPENIKMIQFQGKTNANYSKKIKNKINDIKKVKNDEMKESINTSEAERIKGLKMISSNKKKNNISNNYSFDKEETNTLNENENVFSGNSLIDNFNTVTTKPDINQINININKNNNDSMNKDNIVISTENLNKILLNNYIENKIKEYKIDRMQICLKSDAIIVGKNKNESENIDKVEEKEQLLNQKIKELNKEMVKLKEERTKVSKIKLEYEKSMSKLNNELYQFGQKKEEFEKYRKTELNKIKTDKKNILSESKNMKDIKIQNQTLLVKTKKDKETIDTLKNKITELQSLLKQRDNNNLMNINSNYTNGNLRTISKRSVLCKMNNLAELDIDCINSNQITEGYLGNMKNNNTIRSMTNIKNIFCNTAEDKTKNKINNNNNKEKDRNNDKKSDNNTGLTLKRNNSANKRYVVFTKKIEVVKNGNKNFNNNSLTATNVNNLEKNIISNNNEYVHRVSISKKFLEKSQKNVGNKDFVNERLIFSPQASRTSVGFGLKKLSLKLNNTPKENVKVSKKIFENKKTQNNKKPTYSKTTYNNNNLTSSIPNNNNNVTNNNNNNEIIQNSCSNSNINNNNNNNKAIISNKKLAKEKQIKRQNANDLHASNKTLKKISQKQTKDNILSSKSKNNLLNKPLKTNKKNEIDKNLNDNLNNSASHNNMNKKKILNYKVINKDNISRNNNDDKINATENNIINMKNYVSTKKKLKDINSNSNSNEFDFSIPQKYLNQEYKLIKSLKTDDKIINLYTNDKKEIIFKSGVKKEIYQDGHQIIYFSNGDIKQIYPDGKSYYYFKESKTVQITLNNGMEIYKFENGQIEKHYPDGTKQILFKDGSERYIYNDGFEETYFSDGNVQKIDSKKNIIVEKMVDGEDE